MELICSHTSLVNKGFITELKGKNVYQEQSRQESLAAMLVSLHGTAATWHLQSKLTLCKFRCKISLTLSEAHEKLHSLKKLGDSQLSPRQTPLGPALSVHLIDSQIKGVKKDKEPTLGVRFTEVSVKRESTYCLWLL